MSDVNQEGRKPTAAQRRRPRRLAWIALIGLAVLAGAGYAWYYRLGPGAKTESAYITATVQRGDIEDQVSATGSLQPRDYVDVGAQVSGQLRKIHVEVGSEVKEGDLLAEIDAETSSARVDASRAQLRSQQAQMAERELTLAKAERDLQRQKNLMAEEATTAETLQNAETAVRTARAQIQSLKAQMEQVQASMRVEEANLKFTKIYAPMSGTVVSVTARQGQTLNTNQQAPTLMRIADLSVMTVQTQVSEADVSKLRQGMPVYFTTLGGQGRRWYGDLKKIEPTPTVTNNVVLYNALFEVPNPNRSLMTQMTAQVFFVVAEAKDVLVVPMSALTLQRGAQGARGGQGAGQGQGASGGGRAPGAGPAAAPPSAPSAPARPTSSGAAPASPFKLTADAAPAAAGERPRTMDREAFQNMSEEERQRWREQRRKEREAAGATGAGAPGAGGERPRTMDREAFQNLSEEERQRLREQRSREREQAQAGGGAKAGGSGAQAAPQKAPAAAGATGAARPSPQGQQPPAGEAAATAPPVSSGIPPASARPARGPRLAKVKVMAADGTIEEREITIGISNRVHAEVLSGLKEGDRVIAGVREPDAQRRTTPTNPSGPGLGGVPGGMPGGAAAGARR